MFYILSFFCLLTVFLLIGVANPIYCIFSLVLLFLCVALLTLLLGVDFLPIVFIIVYVGAVAVLFLFVVMILNIKLYRGSLWVSLFPLPWLGLIYAGGQFQDGGSVPSFPHWVDPVGNTATESLLQSTSLVEFPQDSVVNWVWHLDGVTNVQALGITLFTHYYIHLLLAGLILLVAILGAIVLTHQKSKRHQKIFRQVVRQPFVGLMKSSSSEGK